MEKRKIILNLAMSLDGFIADKKGGFEWIVGDGNKKNDTKKQFDFPEFMKSVDSVIMGKTAYLDCPDEMIDQLKAHKIYVASNEKLDVKHNNVIFINGDIVKPIVDLKCENGRNIWIYGGGKMADTFIKAEIIDEYIVGIIPIMLGSGIPLFLKDNPKTELKMTDCTVQEGIVILKYSKR